MNTVVEQAREIFDREFGTIAQLFWIQKLTIGEALSIDTPEAHRPGVYVFFHPEHGVLRIGRHLWDAQWRVRQHWRAWIEKRHGEMAGDGGCVLFFTVDVSCRHWVAAVEIYLEERLRPHCKQGRL